MDAGPLPAPIAKAALKQLFEAVGALHDAGGWYYGLRWPGSCSVYFLNLLDGHHCIMFTPPRPT